MDPFSTLPDADEATDAAGETPETVACLVFRTGSHWYGVRAELVLEVTSAVEVVPVPSVPAFIEGVRHHSGHVVPVLSLSTLLHRTHTPSVTETSRHLVVTAGGARFGLSADEVAGLVEFPRGKLRASEDAGPAVAVAGLDDRLISFLDLDRLLAAAEAGAT